MAITINREEIYSTFFALVTSDPGFKTKSRLWKHFSELDDVETPAIYMTQVREVAERKGKGLNAWRFYVNLHLYVKVGQQGDMGAIPATILNPLVDKVCDLIQPSGSDFAHNEQTLGGLVEQCAIEGDIITDEGLFGPLGVALIPAVILVPGYA